MGRTRGAAVLAGWMLGLAGLLAALVAAGDGGVAAPPIHDPGSSGEWLAARTAPEAAIGVARLVGAVLAAYLLLTTPVAVALRLGHAGRLVAVADVVTLPLVQRFVQLGVGVGLAGATVAAVGAGPGPGRVPTAAEVALVSSATPAPVPTADPPVLDSVDTAPPVLRKVAPATEPADARRTWTVAPGDHLWSIAERVLADAWGRPATDTEIAPFWVAVVDGNRDRLADPANPDLLFPGQTIEVPTPPPFA